MKTLFRRSMLSAVCTLACVALQGQQKTPQANLQYIQNIIMPTWTNTGSTQANLDLFAFNPRTRVMYVADRTNHSVTAIDTITNVALGIIPVPGSPSPNGVLVVPDLQKLVVTDGKANVFVYDLRLPAMTPDQYALPGITSGTDALDYDPLNHTVYVINGSAPYMIIGIDLLYGKIRGSLALPGSPELMRFNPNDGLIYQVITDGDNKNAGAGLYVYDPVANAITAKYLTSDCVPHGIDIDPVTNVALLGCGTNQGQVMMDLRDGSIIKRFPDVTGTDLLAFNPNTRNFYTGSAGNVSTTTTCPTDTTKSIPVIGVFNSPGAGMANLVGVTCAGRSVKGPGVDTVDNFVYVGTRQYPVDPSDPNTGSAGVSVYWDPTPSSNPTGPAHAVLSAGTVQFTRQTRGMRGFMQLKGVTGTTALISVPTIRSIETIPCWVSATGAGYCDGPLFGDPLVGSTAILGVDGAPVSKGVIVNDNPTK